MESRTTWHVAVLPGDGVGPEVTTQAVRAVAALSTGDGPSINCHEFSWPSHAWHREHGEIAPPDYLQTLAEYDAILLGALGDPGPADDPDRYLLSDAESLAPLLAIRKHFDQWSCERPCRPLPGAPQFLADPRAADIDMLVIRENSEGEYVGQGGRLAAGTVNETVSQVSLFTYRATERIIRHAFESARRRAATRRDEHRMRDFAGCEAQVCLITKRNALKYWGEMYTEVFRDVAADYPDVATRHELIDAACMSFVTRPWAFDVVVGSNLHGDILTDLAAVLNGGMGVAPSANLNPGDRSRPPMFEPTHGSAPDIAGRNRAGPAAMLLTTAMMLDWMGKEDAAAADAGRRLWSAVATDLAAEHDAERTTEAVGDAVIRILQQETW